MVVVSDASRWTISESADGNGNPYPTTESMTHSLNRFTQRSVTDTVRRHKPQLPLLNPTSRNGYKMSFDAGQVVTEVSYWPYSKSYTRRSGPLLSGFDIPYIAPWVGSDFQLRSNTDGLAALRNKALLEVSDRKLDIATSLGEAKTTVAWFAARVQTLAEGLVAIKRGRIKDFAAAVNGKPPGPRPRWVKDIARYKPPRNPRPPITQKTPFGGNAADRWLEYNYGLMPVLYDVVGCAEILAQYFADIPDNPLHWVRVKTTTKDSYNSKVKVHGGATGYLHWEGYRRWTGTLELWYTIDQTLLKRASEAGLLSPGVVWELTPYSFVVDMVLPIGDFIEACGATLGCTFQSGWEREFSDGFMMVSDHSIAKSSGNVAQLGSGFLSHKGFKRTVLYSFPAPQLYLKNPLNPRNSVTLLALLRQLF